jgi:TIR domain
MILTGDGVPGRVSVPKDAMQKKTVFISHISDETELAQWLKARLHRDFLGMLDVFVSSDRSTIGAGRKWLDEVDKALKRADLQIVLCSRESMGRPWVNFEAGAVWLRGIPVVPVCHSGLQPDDLPIPLSMLQGIALSRPEGLAKLYDAVASTLPIGSPPSPDFAAVAREAGDLEAKYARHTKQIPTIENPRVLCAASEQYAQPKYGFDLDIKVVERYFPGRVAVEHALTSQRLLDRLTSERFDIVHLVTAVDPDNGALIFDPVDEETRQSTPGADHMLPPSFATLLVEAQTRLVVLATCKALLLAVEVATVANMAASDQDITGEEAADWEDCFYRLLVRGSSVHKAFEITKQQREAPIRAVRHKDVIFRCQV